MKRLLLLALAAGCGRQAAPSPSATGSARVQGQGPVTVLEDTPERVVLLVRADGLAPATVTLAGESYTRLAIAGFATKGATGAPELPRLRTLVGVPVGHAARVEVIDRGDVETLTLDHPVSFATNATHDATSLAARDADAYQRSYGAQLATLDAPSFMGAFRVAPLTVTPVAYDAATGTATHTGWMKLEVTFPADPSLAASAAPVSAGDAAQARHHVVNAGVFAAEARPRVVQPVDLVIAAEAYRDALQPLLAFKREQGREVREKYVGRVTTAEVKALIAAEYRAATPPSNVLLVGSIAQIPAWRTAGIWTDVNYAQLDSGDIPDASLGRIPAQTADELSAYVAKAIARASKPHDKEKVLLTAGSDTSLGCPANVDRVGQILRQYRATLNVQKLYRVNGATQRQIIDGYNANPNLVVYDGHGDQNGMQEIPFLISHLPQLTNESYPIILDIACLNANWPSSGPTRRNFAESILLRPDRGAAGIVAAGGNSGGHEFFQSLARLMTQSQEAMLDETAGPTPDEIGQIVLAAKVEAQDSEDRYMFNFYGDPALAVFH